jgi:hypothetical protein
MLFVLSTTLALGAGLAGAQTAMGARAASMQPGTFATLTTTNIAAALSQPGAAGGILGYAEDGAWDPGTRQFFFTGNDHYFGEPLRFIAYSADTNTWRTLSSPPWGSADPIHAYDHHAINPATGDMYYRRPGTNIANVYRYRISTGTWTTLPQLNVSEYIEYAFGMEYFPELGGLVVANGGGGANRGAVYLFRESTQQWTTLARNLSMGALYAFAEYDPVHKVVLFGGGVGSQNIYKLDASGTVTALGQAPIALGTQMSIVTVDPVSGNFLVFGDGGEFYVYNIVTNTWQLRPQQNVFDPIVNGTSAIWQVVATPVSTYGVVMFVKFNHSQSTVYLYKHTASETVAPSVPPGLTVH